MRLLLLFVAVAAMCYISAADGAPAAAARLHTPTQLLLSTVAAAAVGELA